MTARRPAEGEAEYGPDLPSRLANRARAERRPDFPQAET